ncbi:AAA domain-containing protein [Alkalihalobacterium chitinilyticum]|uniref:AAA domain-containing protein n=1 Tax=Alkalihalobacterium chitinilyticum TaxID=2980103 RepID=A0ABT5VDK3_9BACI|nr:AAA domain-containing protein [Alkalihalobacterium chitinilyticum]MDE5413540.1 AAA domain-containing protein [Alkalihalobacterium chitinilyticum]
MTSTVTYLKEWQKALQIEIQHLKKYGSNKYRVVKGHLLSSDDFCTYYFETTSPLRVPVGSNVRLEWGNVKQDGRILSSEGKSILLSVEQTIGDLIPEAAILYDPWELLDELIERLEEIKKNKKKRARVKRLMDPTMEAKQPAEPTKTAAHELYLRTKANPVTFVWGPPGTGKTYTLARVAANMYFNARNVLILSHSNQAVDVLSSEIATFIQKKNRFEEGEILRYGSQVGDLLQAYESLTTTQLIEKREPQLAEERETLLTERRGLKQDLARSFSKRDTDQLLEIETKIARVLEKIRQKEIQYVKQASIVCTTLAKAATDATIYEKEYDVVIVDEASMAHIPQTAFATSLGKRVVVCGDFKQLPPIAAARHKLVDQWLKEDIFHRAGIVDVVNEGTLHPHLYLLKEQRRMHPEISAFTNQYIYQGHVGDHPSVVKQREKIVSQQPFPKQASILVDTSYTGEYGLQEKNSKSRFNLWQLLLSFQLIHEAFIDEAKSIGYVTPYRAQAQMMELLLKDIYEKEQAVADIISATVHRFQGSERDVMIFDSVDTFPEERAGMLLIGKDSERLINVAITRTKGKFIHVSNTAFIKQRVFRGKTLRQLVEYQTDHQQLITPQEIGTWIKNQHPRLQWVHALKLEHVFRDIQRASESIVLSLPNDTVLPNVWSEQFKTIPSHVKITILSSNEQKINQPFEWVGEEIPFPFVIIDKRLLWLGLPLEAMKRNQPPYVATRLDSKAVVEQFLDQLPITE